MIKNPTTQAIISLLQSERFYAEIILQMTRIMDPTLPAPAGVCIKEKIELHINPELFNKYTTKEQVAILTHEVEHILYEHISRAKEIIPEVYVKSTNSATENEEDHINRVTNNILNNSKHMAMNVAADMAINPGIPNIPASCAMPEKFNLPTNKTMEWYFTAMKNDKDTGDMTGFDSHVLWGDSESDKELLKEKVRAAVKEARDNAVAAGSMSSSSEMLANRLLHRAKDWRAELHRFVSHSSEVKLELSRRKRNRRYGIQYPGTVKVEKLHIGVAIDTSGSVPDKALSQFMAEIANIAKYATVSVVEADCAITNSYVFDPKKQYTIKGRGGTAYQPALTFFTDKHGTDDQIDALIYFGDMDCAGTPEKPKYPVLWAVYGKARPPVKWGRTTNIEISMKMRQD